MTNNGHSGIVRIWGLITAPPVLFESKGSTTTYDNSWSGWYIKGSLATAGEGKREFYDTLPLTGVRFEDDSGRFIQYELAYPYRNKTLLEIVQGWLLICLKLMLLQL